MIRFHKPKVLMVCTREIPEESENGRERTMAFIRRSLSQKGEIQFLRLRSVLEQRSIRQALHAIAALIGGVLKGRPLPLQTLLFLDPRRAREVEAAVLREKPDTVYLDGVRSGILSIPLRKKFPELRIVCDFDDLMSRRMEALALARAPISMGYLSKSVPRWVQAHLLDGFLGRAVLAYEKFALASLEKSIANACDGVVLVSSAEARELLKVISAPVHVIPPVMHVQGVLVETQSFERFVFIGSDRQLQNRLSIEFLVDLWRRKSPLAELHIFGKQTGQYAKVPRVVFHGFVKNLADAYLPGSILLAPAFLSGGVKTKVLEAMAHGVVPLGTSITFEGIEAPCEALVYADKDWESVVSDPSRFYQSWKAAGRRAIDAASQSHSAHHLAMRWCQVVWPQ